MAEVVNDRDVQLQASSERLSVITMQPNIQVSQDQVAGLGITLLASKSVSLRLNSQAFVVAGDGSHVPTILTFTPIIKNLLQGAVYTVLEGTANLTVANDFSASLAFEDMTSDVVKLNIKITQDGQDYIDEVTVVKLYTDSLTTTAVLSNEMDTVPADSYGNVTNYGSAVGQFHLFDGSSDVSERGTYSLAPNGLPSGVTATISSTGVYSVTKMPDNVDFITVTFRASYHNVNYDLPFTVRKSKAFIRGTMTFRIPVTAIVWSDTVADTAANDNGGRQVTDTVTQYNVSANWAETRFWTGSGWAKVDATVDGNMLVAGAVGAREVTTDFIESKHVKTQGLTAENIDTRGLSIRDEEGNIILAAGTPLDYSNVVGGPSADSLASITLVTGTTDMSTNGNEATKNTGSPAWDTGVRSAESYSGGAYASAIVVTTDKALAFGLNSDPSSSNDQNSIDYAWVLNADGTLSILESGTFATTTSGSGGSTGGGGTPSTGTGMLDTLGLSAAAAFSTRRLRSAYTGYCLEVMRSGDNVRLDVGFDANGDLDTATITNFLGAASGYVRSWYDQSGNNRHLYNAGDISSMPRIALNGVVDKLNGRSSIVSPGNRRLHSDAFSSLIPVPWSRFYVARIDRPAPSGFVNLVANLSSTVEQTTYLYNNSLAMHGPSGSDAIIKTELTIGAIGQVSELWTATGAYGNWNGVKGGVADIGAASVNGIVLFSGYTYTEDAEASVPELVILAQAPSTTVVAQIESNQKAYFGTP